MAGGTNAKQNAAPKSDERKASNGSSARKASNAGSARSSSKASSARKSPAATGSARKRSGSQAAAATRPSSRAPRSRSASSKSAAKPKGTVAPVADKPGNVAGKIAKGALGVIVGGAAVGLAGRAVVKRNRRPTVLGVKLPRGVARNIERTMSRGLDVKTIAKQVELAADRLERASEDIRLASAQAKRVSQKLS